jgi:hypothetical protein
MGLEGCNHISKLCVLNCPEKNPTVGAVVVVEIHFALETEVEEIHLRELEDVGNVGPDRHLDWDDRIKTWHGEFQNTLQVIITVVGLITDGG